MYTSSRDKQTRQSRMSGQYTINSLTVKHLKKK